MLSDEREPSLRTVVRDLLVNEYGEQGWEDLGSLSRIVAFLEDYQAEQVEAARQAYESAAEDVEHYSAKAQEMYDRALRAEAAERALVERIEAVLPKADDALSRWRTKGPTSLTIALCVEALMEVRAALVAVASTDEETGR